MTWRNRLWVGGLVGLWGLLLVGCSGDSVDDDEIVQPGEEPTIEELGLRLAPEGLDLDGLSPAEIDQIARGSYLVNGVSGGCGCHTLSAGYLAGGLEFPLPFPDIQGFTSVFARNLTPDPETGFDHTEDEFIEMMRTGKDFTDSTEADPQQMIIMPWHVFRFMSLDDLKAIFAFLRRIPPVRNEVRETFIPPFPVPPVSFPPALGDGDPGRDPDHAERGLRIPEFFSTTPEADAFVEQFNTAVAALTPDEQAQVGRGSYLVNAMGDCNGCHTDGAGDGNFDNGLIPGSVDVNTVTYLAGGVNLGPLLGLDFPLLSRNLTPHPDTGLPLTEEEFIQTMRFGADFRRPGGSLRLQPHFPTEFRLILDDLKAIYAYLQAIPPIGNDVEVVP